MKLSELQGSAAIIGFSEDELSERLKAMGCTAGNEVRFILKKGKLCEYKIGETLIAVRQDEADGILAE